MTRWWYRYVNGSTATSLLLPNSTTVDQSVGEDLAHTGSMPLMMPVPDHEAPCPTCFPPAVFKSPRSRNWFSNKKSQLKYNGKFQSVKQNEQFVLALPAFSPSPSSQLICNRKSGFNTGTQLLHNRKLDVAFRMTGYDSYVTHSIIVFSNDKKYFRLTQTVWVFESSFQAAKHFAVVIVEAAGSPADPNKINTVLSSKRLSTWRPLLQAGWHTA